MDIEIERHQQALIDAFADVLTSENRVSAIKTQLDQVTARLTSELHQADASLQQAWAKVEELLGETGEVETILPGAVTDYKIGWSKARESIKVEPDAVPDDWTKIERKPRLKEIGEMLRAAREAGQPLPNWGRLEPGKPKLVWSAVKKKATL